MAGIDQEVLERFGETVGDAHLPARHYAEGAVLLAAGEAAAAVDCFERAVESGESRFAPKIAHGLCSALLEAGRVGDAEPIARALVDQRPDLVTPHLLLGACLLRQQRPEEALAAHRRALERGSQDIDVIHVIADGAVALEALGRFAEGEQWCVDGLARLSAPNPTLTINLAAFRFRLGKLDAARDALRATRAVAPDLAAEVAAMWADYGDGSPL